MVDLVEPLIRDLLLSLTEGERSYHEMIAAWRTSCPRLPVWEEAHERGLIERKTVHGQAFVALTPQGAAFISGHVTL